jgi:ADYC domain
MPCLRRRLAPALLLGLAAGCLATGPGGGTALAAGVREVAIEGTVLEVTLDDGRVLAGDGLLGAVMEAEDERGASLTARIDGYRPDPIDPSGETVLYALSTPDPAAPGGWRELCRPAPDGTRAGFPLAGAWTATGEHVAAEPSTFVLTCTSGAIGKCVRAGYRPWRGPEMWDLHQACVRLFRADYCGDGRGHTRDGTRIDLYDRLGVQEDEPGPGMRFEAAWGPAGAACVARPRVPDLLAP